MIQIVVESDIRRLLPLEETACLIKERLDKDISINYISTIKNQARKGREYISLLAKNRDTYVYEYLTLIEGAKLSEGELCKIALNS